MCTCFFLFYFSAAVLSSFDFCTYDVHQKDSKEEQFKTADVTFFHDDLLKHGLGLLQQN